MADDEQQHLGESDSHGDALLDKVTEKLHAHHDSSSSSSDDEKPPAPPPVAPVTGEAPGHSIFSPASSSSSSSLPSPHPNVRSKIYRLFGREQPVHKVLGGGKTADIFLWRNKKLSGTVLGVATVIWFLFELLEYHLLTLFCHLMILALSILFLWSHATSFINKSPPQIPDVQVPEKAILEVASMLRYEINRSLVVVRQVANGKDRKQFLAAIGILWFMGVVSSWFSFLTLCYLFVLMLHTVPLFYEKYEDQVDAYGEKAAIQIQKYYAEFNGKVLSKVPKGPLNDKKAA